MEKMGQEITFPHPPKELGEPLGMYSHVALCSPGKLALVAGQLSVDASGSVVGKNDFDTQMRQVFANMRYALEAADLSFDDVVKFTTYLTHESFIEPFYRVREKLFPKLFSSTRYPPNTLLVVRRLVREEFYIELEAIASKAN